MLKYFLIFLLFFLFSGKKVTGSIDCISCIGSPSGRSFNKCLRYPDSYDAEECEDGDVCRTMLQISDGSVAVVQRGCGRDTSSEVGKFLPEECHLDDNSATISCYYTCRTNKCNNITIVSDNPKSCLSDCSSDYGHGYCDYTTGLCVCSPGWSGSDCGNVTKDPIAVGSVSHRRCVQCSQLIDPDCAIKTSSTQCQFGSDKYCVTKKTTIFDDNRRILSEQLTRGCSSSHHHNDRCIFTPTSTSSSLQPTNMAYTCTSTCATDGCNTGIPDGRISGNEKPSLYCLVCEDDRDDGYCARGESPRVRCRHSEGYCRSIVTYYVSQRNDVNYKASPEYKFEKIIRSCSKKPVTRACKSHSIGSLSAKQVTCKETCGGDGCNDGWPARPKCAQCVSDFNKKGTSSCRLYPDLPTKCTKPYDKYCVAIEYKIKSSYNKPDRSSDRRDSTILRRCSFDDVGSECTNITRDGVDMLNCNKTCSSDGCNLGVLIQSDNGASPLSTLNQITTILSTLVIYFITLLLIT